MNTELLKSKLLEAAFNGSLTHADTSKWEKTTIGDVISFLRTGLNPRVHFVLNTPDADGFYITVRELKGLYFEPDNKTDRINKAAVLRINERSRLKVGDVLFSGTGTIGKTAIVNEEPTNWGIKEGVYALTPIIEKIGSKFLTYYLHSPSAIKEFNMCAYGSTVNSVPMAKMRTIPITLPSLTEQQRIVSVIEEGFAAIDAIAEAKENLTSTSEMLRSKILQAAFDGSLTDADTETWEHKKLRDISTKIVDGDHNPPKGQKEPTPYIMLSSQNINEDKFVAMNKVRYLSKADFDFCNKRTKLTKGDVLLTTVGTVGRSCVNTGDEVYCFQRSVTIITPAINSFFLKYYFDSPDFQQLLLLSASGNAQKGFYLNKLKEVEIPVPPLADQQRIVAKIEELFAEIDKLCK